MSDLPTQQLHSNVAHSIDAPLSRSRRISHRLDRRAIVALSLIGSDVTVVGVFAAAISMLNAAAAKSSAATIFFNPTGAAIVAFSLVAAHHIFGLYDQSGKSPVERLRLRSLSALLLGGLGFAVLLLLRAPLSLLSVVPAFIISSAILGYLSERLVRKALIRTGAWMAPTIIVGDDADARELAMHLAAVPVIGLRPVAFLDTDALSGLLNEKAAQGATLPLIPAFRNDGGWGTGIEIALIRSGKNTPDTRFLAQLPFPYILLMQEDACVRNLFLQTRDIGGAVGLEMRCQRFPAAARLIKRGIDLLISVPLFIISLPVIGVLAFLIKAIDPGKAFYVQSRVGYAGRNINVIKLRSMYHDADQRLQEHLQADPAARKEWSRYFKLTNDPRILPVIGKFIRRYSLDELPQLWNVVKGDMSLVGPRPFPAYHMEHFDPAFRELRTSVAPGLTGLWQVSARSNGDLAVQEKQDTFYIRNWSFWLDLYILLETPPAVLKAQGAR